MLLQIDIKPTLTFPCLREVLAVPGTEMNNIQLLDHSFKKKK